ncbi:DUF1778 domain-containing protein [Akkermansia muciniphila]|uniref:DUF1778 domain-containing protein n=1 Tax=Akkermansia muciniphila TaxID=239935 RepID=UPI00260FDDDA|nr:DUF1778 domain-containing protein [Akkermansia muciniphila]WMB14423.1 DUF1778 domain-containing protein [Akkermansia muciniphila]WMB18862.1 DUF1778 domain-containing protein [Akkermansia muciniphila]
MTPTKEEIKKWLKSIEKDRDWLAEQCFVKRSAVNSWLSTDRGIPPAKLALIKNLMEDEIIDLELIRKEMNRQGEEAARTASSVPILNGVAAVAVPLSEDDLKLISKAAQISGQTIEEFIRSAALEDAGE